VEERRYVKPRPEILDLTGGNTIFADDPELSTGVSPQYRSHGISEITGTPIWAANANNDYPFPVAWRSEVEFIWVYAIVNNRNLNTVRLHLCYIVRHAYDRDINGRKHRAAVESHHAWQAQSARDPVNHWDVIEAVDVD
jgi:hypothetical protein